MAIEVATAEDLYNVRNDIYSGVEYIQTADIDLSVYPNWEPISNNANYDYTDESTWANFNYNGNGYKITGLKTDNASYYNGLFGILQSDSNYSNELTLKNINIENCDISTTTDYSGGLVGYVDLETDIMRIENCHISGSVQGSAYVGGIVGFAQWGVKVENSTFKGQLKGEQGVGGIFGIGYSLIDNRNGLFVDMKSHVFNCSVEATITASEMAGGIVGYLEYYIMESAPYSHEYAPTLLENTHFTGEIIVDTSFSTWQSEIGGLIGWLRNGKIINCSAEVTISNPEKTAYNVGGLIGWADLSYYVQNTIEKCYSKVQITADDYIGGLCGIFETFDYSIGQKQTAIKNCYTIGSIDSTSDTGGFIYLVDYGANEKTSDVIIANSYSAVNMTVEVIDDYVGGFIADFYGRDYPDTVIVKDCYFDSNLADFEDKGWGTPRTTEEMTEPPAPNTYLNWNFGEVWFIYADVNDGYPQFEFYVISDDRIFFLAPPEVREEIPRVNQLTVRSPEAEYLKTFENVSRDKYIERIVELDQGDFNVCKTVAERLADVWGRKRTSIIGEVFLRQDLSFKNVVRIKIPEIGLNGPMKVQRVAHDVINQRTKVTCGDLILSDNELLSRILAEI